jgi:type I restriction enzyme S subunit
MEIDESGLAYLDMTTQKELAASETLPGDLLIVKASVGEKICRQPERISRANITQHIIAIRPNGRADMDYVSAALFAGIGRRQLSRRALGSIIQYLGVADTKEVLIPSIATEAQRYIGDKVRQAERLRERARSLESQFTAKVFDGLIPPKNPSAKKTNRIGLGDIGRNLNPGAYMPDRQMVRKALLNQGGVYLSDLGEIQTPTGAPSNPETVYLGLDGIDSGTCSVSGSTVGEAEAKGTSRLLKKGPAIAKLRPYLNKVTYIPEEYSGGLGSTELLLVSPTTDVSGWYIYGVLKLGTTVRQLNSVAKGSTHPRVDRDDVLDVIVPMRDNHLHLGGLLETAQLCYFTGNRLTTAATKLVEHLIEGQISEADLITAQKQLDAGDPSTDRAILGQLRAGQAEDAPPLFPDLDALYALLDGDPNDEDGD